MKFFDYKNEKGFTLVETLVAVAIFATSITGLISITARGINDTVFVKNKLTASYLAQEGVEIIRSMRDTSALVSLDASYWSEFITSPGYIDSCYSTNGTNSCYIDGSAQALVALPCSDEGVCPVMKYNQDQNSYGYSSLEDSIFTRKITIVPVGGSGSSEILINSEVSWTQGSRTFTTSFQYNLFNWIF
jgi:prepilin-type N-terminal cleavage/methylation domain-containing protein